MGKMNCKIRRELPGGTKSETYLEMGNKQSVILLR